MVGLLQFSTTKLLAHSFPLIKLSSSSYERNASVPPVTAAYNTSRRLALLHLATVIPQSQLLESKALQLQNSDKTSDQVGENLLDWTQNDKRRMLHVVYCVGDLEKTIKFYTECLGMKVLRQRDIPKEKYSNAFVGYGPEETHFPIELTYNYGVEKYDIGNGFGHFSIAVKDVAKTVNLVKAKGGKVTQEPNRIGNTVTAFIEDPTGYKFELLETGPTRDPLTKLMLRVGDLDRSINFYQKAYGMEVLYKTDNTEKKSKSVVMSYGPDEENFTLELTYNYGITKYDKGNGYGQIAIGTDDVYKTAEKIKLYGGEIVLEPGPLPVINTKITACLDPDGWKSVFVDNIDFQKELA